MSYPTVDFRPIGKTMGVQPINETSTTQKHPLGFKVDATDYTYGTGTFVYLKGVASTTAGDLVCYDQANGDTARAVAGGADSTGACAVAMSANVASQYGWYQVFGAGPVKAATVAADTPLYLTSTAGQVDDAATSNKIDGITSRSATSGGFATCQLDYPSITGSASSATAEGSLLKVALVVGAEGAVASDAIEIACTVTDLTGTVVSAAKNVVVRTLAVTADKGDIAAAGTPVGTLKKADNPATGFNEAWFVTTAGGLFSFRVSNDQTEDTLVEVIPESGVPTMQKITFA